MKEREIANLYVFVERYTCIYTTLHPTTSLDIDIRLSFCTSICILGWKNIFMMSLSLIFPLALVHDRVDSKPIDATPAVLCVGWSRLFVKRENVYPYFTHSLSLTLFLPRKSFKQKKRQWWWFISSTFFCLSLAEKKNEMNCFRRKKNCASHKTQKKSPLLSLTLRESKARNDNHFPFT